MLRWIFVLALIYCSLLLLVFLFQERLLFFPQRVAAERVQELRNRGAIESLELRMSDGVTVRGWLVRNQPKKPLKLLFYYGGNAEELSALIDDSQRFGGYSPVLVNYRGYGESEGNPGEQVLQRDALEIYDALTHRSDVSAAATVLMGRSLGTGIAVHVAANRPHAGVILISPYDSMTSLARLHYPLLPTGWLLRHRFESIRLAPAVKSPVLILAAGGDTLVPLPHSRTLAEHWGGKIDFVEIGPSDHNSISFHPLYWLSIERFLQSLTLAGQEADSATGI